MNHAHPPRRKVATVPDDVRKDFISYKIGDDRPVAWEVLEVDGEPLNAAGFMVKAQVRAHPGTPVLHEWSSGPDGNGRARLSTVPADSETAAPRWYVELLVDDSRSWSWERGHYDVFLFDPEGRAQPIAEGPWVNRPVITDA